jgi:hypothetical protein
LVENARSLCGRVPTADGLDGAVIWDNNSQENGEVKESWREIRFPDCVSGKLYTEAAARRAKEIPHGREHALSCKPWDAMAVQTKDLGFVAVTVEVVAYGHN